MKVEAEQLKELKNKYGEAFYLLDTAQFTDNYRDLKGCFKAIYHNFNIAYSYKTNYIPKICKIVNELGGYAEVVSEMELELARRINVPEENIIWNGPVKNYNCVEKLLLEGGCVNVDSLDEAVYICEIASQHVNQVLRIGIRCNFDIDDGVVSRFGFDTEGDNFKEALKCLSKYKNIEIYSFQCHFAKRQIDFWANRAKGMVKVLEETKIMPKRIDLGGGLYGHMPSELKNQFSVKIPSYEEYAMEAATIIADYFKNKEFKPELVIEPGSALVGDCMSFVCEVKTIKNVRDKYFATVMGSQKNISMAGINPPITVVHTGKEQKKYKDMDIVGYTCIEGDVLFKNYEGELSVGDTIIVDNCGSYSVVMKPPFILPNFPVLDISSGGVDVIKNAECFDDIFRTYNY